MKKTTLTIVLSMIQLARAMFTLPMRLFAKYWPTIFNQMCFSRARPASYLRNATTCKRPKVCGLGKRKFFEQIV